MEIKKMKAILLTIGLVFSFTLAASAQTKTPLVNKRQQIQKHRVFRGIKSGDLSFKETNKLLKQQAKIRKFERKAKSDGKVTLIERLRLQRKLNQESRSIRRKKTN